MREYTFLSRDFPHGEPDSTKVQSLIAIVQDSELDHEDLWIISDAEGLQIMTAALQGAGRGWNRDAMSRSKAESAVKGFFSFFQPIRALYTNSDKQSWLPLYESNRFIYSDLLIAVSDRRAGLLCIQEND